MANTKQLKETLSTTSLQAQDSLQSMLSKDSVKARFQEILGKRSAAFISSILSVASLNKELKVCDPSTVIASAAIAATLDLPISQSLGFAFIVPYGGKAQFQLGSKGYIQLAIRSGQYETIHASEVYSDEIKYWNPLTAEFKETDPSTWKIRYSGDKESIVGYVAFFRLLNGFTKYLYMTTEELEQHGRRYSKSFSSGNWSRDFKSMALKTVLKMLLSKYGILSIEMQKAIQADQAVVSETVDGEKYDYGDAVETEATKEDQGKLNESIDATAQESIPFGD